MSTRAALLPAPATHTGGVTTPVTPPNARIPMPATTDPLLAAIRPDPAHTVAQIVVAQDGTGDYDNLGDAFAAVEAARSLPMAIKGKTKVDPTVRVDIAVKPGVYEPGAWSGGFAVPWVNVFATDPTPGATVCNIGTEPWGGLYWEGVDIVNPATITTFDPKYAVHMHSATSDTLRGSTAIFARCTLANLAKESGGSGVPIGMDGEKQGTLALHDVRLVFAEGGVARTNLHGWSDWVTRNDEDGPTVGMDVIFSKVAYDGGMLSYDALNGQSRDEMWVVDCTAKGARLTGAATTLHVARSTLDTVTADGARDARGDWPIPTGALSARDRARYGIK